jgi:hypothetical protein
MYLMMICLITWVVDNKNRTIEFTISESDYNVNK